MEPLNENKSNGSLIGILVIVLILVLGGIYLYMSKTANEKLNQENLENTNIENSDNTNLNQEDIVNELNTLESEFENTEVEASVDIETLE